jgi:protein-L-isoaspartate O-methyltransferase
MTYAPYNLNAKKFFNQYQSLTFEQVHGDWLPQLDGKTGLALDVGAGSGRDATGLVGRVWDVVALEPAAGLRELGQSVTKDKSIQWIADQLPDLNQVRKLSYRVNLTLVSAVWMHILLNARERASRILAELLALGGTLVVTLRHGPSDGEHVFYDVSREELEVFAKHRALIPVALPPARNDDELKRSEVSQETLVFWLASAACGVVGGMTQANIYLGNRMSLLIRNKIFYKSLHRRTDGK